MKTITRSPRRLLLLMLAVFLLLSCRLTGSFLGGDGGEPLAGYDVDRDNAIVLSSGQPRTLDPALTRGGPDGALGHIFSGLTTLDTALQVQPDLAAGWQVAENGRVYTFYLRRDAVFHDGRALTAADVIFSWERAAAPETGSDTVLTYLGDVQGVAERRAGAAESINGLRAIDDHTLEVTLTAPVITFLQKLAYPVAFVVDRENVAEADWEYEANGTGPFRLETWRDDEIIILRRHEDFYREPAQIEHLVYLLGPHLPLSLYEQGRLDLVGVGSDTLARVQDPNDPLSDDLRAGVSLCTTTVGMNNQKPPLDDVRVRRAFTLALDRAQLVESLWRESGLAAAGPLPPGMPGYGTAQALPFDPAAARRLLAEAGYPDPADLPPLTYYAAGFDDVGPLPTAVITLWQEELGVRIEPVLIDPYTYNDELYGGNIGHFFSSGWCADYPDPQNFLEILYQSDSRQNLSGFSDPDVDRLLAQARVERDAATRLELYAEAERRIVAEAPVIFLAHSVNAVLVQPRVQNYTLTPLGVPQWGHVALSP